MNHFRRHVSRIGKKGVLGFGGRVHYITGPTHLMNQSTKVAKNLSPFRKHFFHTKSARDLQISTHVIPYHCSMDAVMS